MIPKKMKNVIKGARTGINFPILTLDKNGSLAGSSSIRLGSVNPNPTAMVKAEPT
jgi:hypothetical protein